VRALHCGGHFKFRKHVIVFGSPWTGHQVPITDHGGHLEFYLIPHGELVATLDLPLLRQYNISKVGRFVNRDRKHLPSGVESFKKPT
ncbi:MAG: hypothetical protein ACTMIL_02850, partial [Brevibacterium aurantiacum]